MKIFHIYLFIFYFSMQEKMNHYFDNNLSLPFFYLLLISMRWNITTLLCNIQPGNLYWRMYWLLAIVRRGRYEDTLFSTQHTIPLEDDTFLIEASNTFIIHDNNAGTLVQIITEASDGARDLGSCDTRRRWMRLKCLRQRWDVDFSSATK